MPADALQPPTTALLAGRNGLLVRLTCRPGLRPALLDAVNRYADGLAEEPGTEVFVVSVDPDDGDVVWLYEVFRDEQAQLAHRSSRGFVTLMAVLPSMLVGPPGLLRLDPLRLTLQDAVLADDLRL